MPTSCRSSSFRGLSLGPAHSRFAHDVVAGARRRCSASAAPGRRGASRRAWLLIGIGVLAWALGETSTTPPSSTTWSRRRSPRRPTPATCSSRCSRWSACSRWCAARTRDVPTTLWIDGSIAALAVTARQRRDRVRDRARRTRQRQAAGGRHRARLPAHRPRAARRRRRRARRAPAGGSTAPGCCSPSASSSFWLADSLYLVQTAAGTLQSAPAWFDIGWRLGLLLIALASWQPRGRAPADAPPDGAALHLRAARLRRRSGSGLLDLRLPDRHEPAGRRARRAVAGGGHGAADADLPRERRDAARPRATRR